jgi:uncharacterized protein (TIGR01777 family)
MTILITGATGMIGQELVTYLLQQKHTIHYLTSSKDKIKSSHNLKGFYWNITKKEIDENCIIGVQTIIHLAGASIVKRWTKKYKQEILDSRVQSAKLLQNLLQSTNNTVNHFITASGTAIYPESFNEVFDENCIQKDNSFLSNVIQQWENVAYEIQKTGIEITIVRTGVVFSKKNSALQPIAKPIKLGFAAAIGSGNQLLSWIHIQDLVNIYTNIIENKIYGIVNAVSPNAVTNKSLTRLIAHQLKKPYFLPNIPAFILKIILGEKSVLVIRSENIEPKRLKQLFYNYKFPTINQALIDLL